MRGRKEAHVRSYPEGRATRPSATTGTAPGEKPRRRESVPQTGVTGFHRDIRHHDPPDRRGGAILMRSVVAAAVVTALVAFAGPVQASEIDVPAGTTVPLKFLEPLDSATIKEGTAVKFEVAADVLVGRSVIFRQGAPAQGVVTDVSQPGIFGKNARVHIAYIQATASDGRPVRLSPIDVTPDSIKQVKDVGAAAGTSVAGAILLGPIGLAAGALIHGGNVNVPVGAVGTTKVTQSFRTAGQGTPQAPTKTRGRRISRAPLCGNAAGAAPTPEARVGT